MSILFFSVAVLVTACGDKTKESQVEQQTKSAEDVNQLRDSPPAISEAKPFEMSSVSAATLYADFTKIPPPKELHIPPDKRGWGAMQQIVLSRKYSVASAIMSSRDKPTLTKIWREFAVLSEPDQEIIAMVADLSEDLEQIEAIASAARVAKSEEIQISLLDAASRVVAQALADPTRADAAQRTAQQMRLSGTARPLLIDALAKLNQEKGTD